MKAIAAGALVLAASLALGCGQDQAADRTAPSAAAPQATTAPLATKPSTGAKMDAPAGWEERAEGAWTLHHAPDKRAHLAAAPLGAGDAVAARVAEAVALMGGSDVRTAEEQAITIGLDARPARAASGSCRFGAEDGRVQYAAVDLGDGERFLLVYAAASGAPEDAQKAAFAAIATLRRKR